MVKKKEAVSGPYVARDLKRETSIKSDTMRHFLSWTATHFPTLRRKLEMAGMELEPTAFIAKTLFAAAIYAVMIEIIAAMLFSSLNISFVFLVPLLPVLYIILFFYWMLLPDVKMLQRERAIDQELVFACRHMLIALEGGVPLFEAMVGITRDYGEVSSEFNKIVEKITLGVPMTAAMHDVAERNPSKTFRRVIVQMANSISSGSDIASSLDAVLNQVSKEQVIALKGYGQKLNPLAMFFMLFGVILPSLGVAFLIVILSFVGGGKITMGGIALAGIFFAIVIIQFLFLSMVETSRPKYDIGL